MNKIFNKKIALGILTITGMASLVFLTMAPTFNGTVQSKITTVFNATVVTGTSTATGSWIPIDDSQYFGYIFSQTGTTPSINLTYDESFDGTNIITVATLQTAISTTTPVGGSIQAPVSPLIRFNIIGQASNGTSTATLKFMRQ